MSTRRERTTDLELTRVWARRGEFGALPGRSDQPFANRRLTGKTASRILTTNERIAAWGLRHGNARIWETLLGPERAMKLTRYIFFPLTVILGLIGLALGFISR
jgi:hypothetical protein